MIGVRKVICGYISTMYPPASVVTVNGVPTSYKPDVMGSEKPMAWGSESPETKNLVRLVIEVVLNGQDEGLEEMLLPFFALLDPKAGWAVTDQDIIRWIREKSLPDAAGA